MNKSGRKYQFSWDLISPDSDFAFRRSLGDSTRMEVYRLFQFTLRDVFEQRFGTEMTDEIFRDAGTMAGQAFFERYCSKAKEVADLANIIQEKFKELAIGIVRFESIDLDTFTIVLTIDEDLDCSGLPDTQEQICVYDEGMIKGIFEAFTGIIFHVKEIDCWCTGERTCRFQARAVSPAGAAPD